jgi:hypothetical protein
LRSVEFVIGLSGDPYFDDVDGADCEIFSLSIAFASVAFASSTAFCCPLSVIGFSIGASVFSGTALSTSSFVGCAGAFGFDPPLC